MLASSRVVGQFCFCCSDRKEGGVGDLNYPLVSDLKREISLKYGVLSEDGVALRGLYIIDPKVSPPLSRTIPGMLLTGIAEFPAYTAQVERARQ